MIHLRTGPLRTEASLSEVLLHTIDEIQVTHQPRPVFFISPPKDEYREGWIAHQAYESLKASYRGHINRETYESQKLNSEVYDWLKCMDYANRIWVLYDCDTDFAFQSIKGLYSLLLDRHITIYWIRQHFYNDLFKLELQIVDHVHYAHFHTENIKGIQLIKSLRYVNNSGKPTNLSQLHDRIYMVDFNEDIILDTYVDLSDMGIWWDVANLVKI